jgi:hypothetical protein
MNIEQWFPTTIAYTDNNLPDELPAYLQYCEDLTKIIPNGKPFISSQLTTTFNFKMPQYNINIANDVRFKKLFDIITEQGNMFAKVLGYNYELEVKNSWVNKIGPHDYHGFHSHVSSGNALIVGCFYVDAPVGAKINFKSPYSEDYTPIDPSWDSPYNSKIVSYDCVPGRLMFFKSNILHGYDAHNSDKMKFSIPFDMSVKP